MLVQFAICYDRKRKEKINNNNKKPNRLPLCKLQKTSEDMMLAILRTKTFSASFMNEQALSLLHFEKIIRGHF